MATKSLVTLAVAALSACTSIPQESESPIEQNGYLVQVVESQYRARGPPCLRLTMHALGEQTPWRIVAYDAGINGTFETLYVTPQKGGPTCSVGIPIDSNQCSPPTGQRALDTLMAATRDINHRLYQRRRPPSSSTD